MASSSGRQQSSSTRSERSWPLQMPLDAEAKRMVDRSDRADHEFPSDAGEQPAAHPDPTSNGDAPRLTDLLRRKEGTCL